MPNTPRNPWFDAGPNAASGDQRLRTQERIGRRRSILGATRWSNFNERKITSADVRGGTRGVTDCIGVDCRNIPSPENWREIFPAAGKRTISALAELASAIALVRWVGIRRCPRLPVTCNLQLELTFQQLISFVMHIRPSLIGWLFFINAILFTINRVVISKLLTINGVVISHLLEGYVVRYAKCPGRYATFG